LRDPADLCAGHVVAWHGYGVCWATVMRSYSSATRSQLSVRDCYARCEHVCAIPAVLYEYAGHL
jgi:hypothetical protein